MMKNIDLRYANLDPFSFLGGEFDFSTYPRETATSLWQDIDWPHIKSFDFLV